MKVDTPEEVAQIKLTVALEAAAYYLKRNDLRGLRHVFNEGQFLIDEFLTPRNKNDEDKTEMNTQPAAQTAFNMNTPDSSGVTGTHLLNKLRDSTWMHTGNGKTYAVVGVSWCGESDMWGVVHVIEEEGAYPVQCIRSHQNFLGYRLPGVKRFLQVSGPVADDDDTSKETVLLNKDLVWCLSKIAEHQNLPNAEALIEQVLSNYAETNSRQS